MDAQKEQEKVSANAAGCTVAEKTNDTVDRNERQGIAVPIPGSRDPTGRTGVKITILRVAEENLTRTV